MLPIDRLNQVCLECLDTDVGMTRQIDFVTDLMRENELALIMTTFQTVSWAIGARNPFEKNGKLYNVIQSAQELSAFLQETCSDGSVS